MLVNPVQQSPFAYDGARQLLTPPAPVQPPQPSQAPTAPIQQAQTFQDRSNTGQGSSRGTSGDQGSAQQEQIKEQLAQALLQLEQLREQARAALVVGDTAAAKEAAQEAASVATSIRDLTGASPSVNVPAIVADAQQVQKEAVPSGGGGSSSSGSGSTSDDDTSDVIALARSGVGTANDVVDAAASIPGLPAADVASIAGYKRQVLDAMAGVEEFASKFEGGGTTTAVPAGGVDISV